MFRWLWRLIFESTPVEFRSAFGLEESVERLRAATKRSVFSALSETAAVGKVSEKTVRLQRAIPLVGNSFKPFFMGRFRSSEGKITLVGRFTMLPVIKVFMGFWFGFLLLISLGFLFDANSRGRIPAILGPLAMIGAGVALLAFGKWLARNDIAWLSRVIEDALKVPGASSAARSAPSPADPAMVPITLKAAAIFLAASGAMAALSGLMMSQLPPMPARTGATPPFPLVGQWTLVYAAVVLALAFGVWRRRPWAWRGFFVLLGASACWSIYGMQAMANANAGPPLGISIFFGAACCVVMLIWGRWWYGQRKHFLRN
jgi:hypothetical protein